MSTNLKNPALYGHPTDTTLTWEVGQAFVGDLEVGNLAVFDPVYGAERVMERHEHDLNATARGGSGHPWTALRFQLKQRDRALSSIRYVIRFPHEPVVRIIEHAKYDGAVS